MTDIIIANCTTVLLPSLTVEYLSAHTKSRACMFKLGPSPHERHGSSCSYERDAHIRGGDVVSQRPYADFTTMLYHSNHWFSRTPQAPRTGPVAHLPQVKPLNRRAVTVPAGPGQYLPIPAPYALPVRLSTRVPRKRYSNTLIASNITQMAPMRLMGMLR